MGLKQCCYITIHNKLPKRLWIVQPPKHSTFKLFRTIWPRVNTMLKTTPLSQGSWPAWTRSSLHTDAPAPWDFGRSVEGRWCPGRSIRYVVSFEVFLNWLAKLWKYCECQSNPFSSQSLWLDISLGLLYLNFGNIVDNWRNGRTTHVWRMHLLKKRVVRLR